MSDPGVQSSFQYQVQPQLKYVTVQPLANMPDVWVVSCSLCDFAELRRGMENAHRTQQVHRTQIRCKKGGGLA